jgi:ribosome-binding factor A
MTRRSGGGKGRDSGGRGPSQRQLRVGEELRHALTRVFARAELSDPDLDGLTATITEVRMSPDLRAATAFVTPFGGGDAGKLVKALNRAGGYFRGQIARDIALRHAPTVRFAADRSFDQAFRVDELLHDPVVARDLGEEPFPEDEAANEPGDEGTDEPENKNGA